MAWGAAHLEFIDHCALGDTEIGDMVVLQQMGGATVDARPISFLDYPLLPVAGMTLARRRIDWSSVRIVHQRPNECSGGNPLYRRASDRGAIVERATVGSHMQYHLGGYLYTARHRDMNQSIGARCRVSRKNRYCNSTIRHNSQF